MKQLNATFVIALLALLLSAISSSVLAQDTSSAIMPFDFETDGERQRYQHFSKVLRCPMCQNQNLSGSNAGIATDLRKELHRLITEDYSDQDIIDFMQSRYGNFILYEPPVNKATSVLWFAPIVFLLIGIAILVSMVRRQRSAVDEVILSDGELAAARKELLTVQAHHADESAVAEQERSSKA
ncbi:MAG: cytochrome c-type biogenesis protein CcmH [Pseudomonadales bacterium]